MRFLISYTTMILKQVDVIKRDIKYPRIEIKNFKTKIIIPLDSELTAEKLLEKYKDVLSKKYSYIESVVKQSKDLKIIENENFKEDVMKFVKHYSHLLGISPIRVLFRKMRKRWGSCTKNGVLIFNKSMKFLPKNLVKYVVCHEICHLVVRNHNEEFYELFNKFYKNHKYYRKLLDIYWIRVFKIEK